MAEAKTFFMFHGGRESPRESSLFSGGSQEGGLTIARDAEYRPGDPGIWSVGGTSPYSLSAEAGSIRAGAFVESDTAGDLIVIAVGTNLRKAPAAFSGSFSDFTGVGSPSQKSVPANGLTDTFFGSDTLQIVHYGGEFVVLNGRDRPRVINPDGSMTYLGMIENISPPTVTNTGALAGFTLGSGNFIEYWIEERVKDANGEIIKRNASLSGQVTRITGSGGNFKPRITRPLLRNRETTHWAAFASATNSTYPVGAEIGEVAAATTFIDDPRTVANPPFPSGEAYDITTVTLSGVTQAFPTWGPPPIASTGDNLEDSMVLNDIGNKSFLRFCATDNIHAWPACNVIKFEGKERDDVVYVRNMAGVLVTLMRDTAWRIHTLPYPEDASFQPQRGKEKITGAHGVTSVMAVDTYDTGNGEKLAYTSPYALCVTDSVSWDVLSDDIDWETDVTPTTLSNAHLAYNPIKYRLELSHVAGDGSRVASFFSVHPFHLKLDVFGRGRGKYTGPITRPVTCLFTVRIGGRKHVFAGALDGKVYVMDRGLANQLPNGGINFKVRSGKSYLAGVGTEATSRTQYVHHNAVPGGTAKVSIIQHAEGSEDQPVETTIDISRAEASTISKQTFGEAFYLDVEATNPPGPLRLDYGFMVYDAPPTRETFD